VSAAKIKYFTFFGDILFDDVEVRSEEADVDVELVDWRDVGVKG